MGYLIMESASLVAAEQALRWAAKKRQRGNGMHWEMTSECDEHCADCHRPYGEHLKPDQKCPETSNG
jgi:hypothetical protein